MPKQDVSEYVNRGLEHVAGCVASWLGTGHFLATILFHRLLIRFGM